MRFGVKAKEYRSHAALQERVADWCADWVEADTSDLTAIEFGAGPGILTKSLVQHEFASLVASDASYRMVEEGRRMYPGIGWERVDAWNPVPLQFDRIYSSSLLQWAPEPSSALKAWRSCLKVKGKALVALYTSGSMSELIEISPEVSAVKWREAGEWLRLAEASGLHVLRWEEKEVQQRFDSALAAFRSFHDIGAIQEGRFGVGRLRAAIAKTNLAYEKLGYVPLTWRCLRFEAERM